MISIRSNKFIPLFLFVSIVLTIDIVYAFDNKKVHREINLNAVLQSGLVADPENYEDPVSYLVRDLGMLNGLNEKFNDQQIWKWLQQGGKDEDDPWSRSFRHFHDPLKDWDNAGLTSSFLPSNLSAIYWSQIPEPEDDFDPRNDYSWPAARSYFYTALTASDSGISEDNWAKTFKTLGYVMHLVSDMAVPAHVRNDPHPEVMLGWMGYTHFELYTEDKYNDDDIMKYDSALKPDPALFSSAQLNPLAPSPVSALFDIDVYDGTNPATTRDDAYPVGLAEYTNANFLSEGTIFKNYNYPAKSETNWDDYSSITPLEILSEDGSPETVKYLFRNGDESDKLAALSYFYEYLPHYYYPEATRATILDDEVYKSYAGKLVPKAVGYSSALLDYFFRGRIDARNGRFIKDSCANI